MGEVIVIHSCSSNLLIYSISFSELAICPGSFLGQHSLPTPIYFEPACQWPSHKCHKHVCDCHHTAADDTFYLICTLELSRARDHLKRHVSMHIFQFGVSGILIEIFFVVFLTMTLKFKGIENCHTATGIEDELQSVIAQFLDYTKNCLFQCSRACLG